MTLNEYQTDALEFAFYPVFRTPLYPALGLCGEAGEVAEHIKKAIRDDNSYITPGRRAAIIKELGDVLWYVAAIADEMDVELDEIATVNVAKLRDRQKRNALGGSGDNR